MADVSGKCQCVSDTVKKTCMLNELTNLKSVLNSSLQNQITIYNNYNMYL